MSNFTIEEKEQIYKLLLAEVPEGVSLNDSRDLELDGEFFQSFNITTNKVSILYLLILSNPSARTYTSQVKRLCNSFNFKLGHTVMCQRTEKGIISIVLSEPILP